MYIIFFEIWMAISILFDPEKNYVLWFPTESQQVNPRGPVFPDPENANKKQLLLRHFSIKSWSRCYFKETART